MKLKDFKHGQRVKFIKNGFEVKDAKIAIKNGEYYLCQNHFDGTKIEDRFGYLYSWLTASIEIEKFSIQPASELDLVPTKGIKLLVWDHDESKAIEEEICLYNQSDAFPWMGMGCCWENAKPIPQEPSIEITVKINGKEAKLSDIPDEALKKLKELER